jgi:hypothetical protein
MSEHSVSATDSPQRAVNVYLSSSKDRVVVAPMHQNLAGIYYEQDNPLVLDSWPGPVELGNAFKRAFERFSVVDRDLSSRKSTDWPAFRASGDASVRSFEARYVLLSCHAMNASNSTVRAGSVHPTDPDVEISVVFNPLQSAQEVGGLLLKLFEVANPASDRA